MKFNGNITLNALGQSEVQNLVVERVSATPVFNASEAGRLIYNTTARLYYMNSGLGWVALATGGDAASLQSEVDTLEASIGTAVTSTGAFNAAALEGTNIVSATSLTDAINQLDAAVSGKDALAELADVALAGNANGQFLVFDLDSGKWVNHTLVIGDIKDVTVTAAEVNHLSGVTSNVQAQLNTVAADAASAAADVAADLATEIARATGAEGTLTTNLAAEVQARTDGDAALTTALGTETTARTNADTALGVRIDDEATARGDADALLQAAIEAETTRATGAEGTLSGRITTEVAALTAEDARLAGLIADEHTHHTAAEAALQTAIDAEATARAAADVSLRNDLEAQIAGLTWENAVTKLSADHTAETGLVVGDRVYNSVDHKIYTVTAADPLTFDGGEALVEGAAFFDKDTDVPYVFNGTGMVQFNGASGITAGTGLVKTGNTLNIVSDSGTITVGADTIDVAQSVLDSIDAASDAVDTERARAEAAEAGLGIRVDDEIAARIAGDDAIRAEFAAVDVAIRGEFAAADTALDAKITAEQTRAEAAEAAIAADLLAEVSRATTAEGTLTTNLAAEVTRATAAEGTLTTNLANEVTRATDAEAALQTAIDDEETRALAAEAAIEAKLSKGYFLYDGAAAASHTVTHSIGSRFCNVTVIDTATNEQIIPQSVVFDSATQLTVTFNVALACKVVVMGLGV